MLFHVRDSFCQVQITEGCSLNQEIYLLTGTKGTSKMQASCNLVLVTGVQKMLRQVMSTNRHTLLDLLVICKNKKIKNR